VSSHAVNVRVSLYLLYLIGMFLCMQHRDDDWLCATLHAMSNVIVVH